MIRACTQLLGAVALLAAFSEPTWFAAADCTNGQSDNCSDNPNQDRRSNPYNYHVGTCNFKWSNCVVDGIQKPPPFYLCTSYHEPSGTVPTDAYSLSIQDNDFSSSLMQYTLHGLWPSSQLGRGSKDQPYGCENGAEFDQSFMKSFDNLFKTYWPTNPKFKNTPECFIASEWMKHGTCSVIPGKDDSAFRLSQEMYYRTAIVLTNEFNANKDFQDKVSLPGTATISVDCVTCAYFAASSWSGTDLVPRMPAACVDQCFDCTASNCPPAKLDSTVKYDASNAPPLPSSWGGQRLTGSFIEAKAFVSGDLGAAKLAE